MSLRLLAALAVFLLLAACSPDEGQDTTTSGQAVDTTTTPDTAGPSTTPPTTTPPTTLPPGTEELPEEIRLELAELIQITQDSRELEFIEQPNVVVVSDDELAQRVREQLTEDLEDLPADQALYRLLGLIDDDTDLEQLYTELYSEQVAGYYDGEEGELVVPRAEEGFTAIQRATLVHELTHALTDQHYEFHDSYSALIDADRFDEAAAYQALIEGDAVQTEFIYLQGLTPEEQAQFFQETFGVDQDVFQAAPRFIRDALIFPYDAGYLFVDRLYRTGSFDAVAEAYAAPPTSTEQIIDPEDYPADQPIAVEVADIALDGYELEYQSTWGELGFALMFDQVLTTDASDTAAGGWGGDSYQIHFDGENVVLILRYRGDSAADGEELAGTLREYVETAMDTGEAADFEDGTAYQGEDSAWLWNRGAALIFIASSDDDAFAAAVESVRPETTETTGG